MPRKETIEVTVYDRDDYDNYADNLTDEFAAQLLRSNTPEPPYNFSGTERDFMSFCVYHAYFRAIEALEWRSKHNDSRG